MILLNFNRLINYIIIGLFEIFFNDKRYKYSCFLFVNIFISIIVTPIYSFCFNIPFIKAFILSFFLAMLFNLLFVGIAYEEFENKFIHTK